MLLAQTVLMYLPKVALIAFAASFSLSSLFFPGHSPGDVHAYGHSTAQHLGGKAGFAVYRLELVGTGPERGPPEPDTSAPLTRSRSSTTRYYSTSRPHRWPQPSSRPHQRPATILRRTSAVPGQPSPITASTDRRSRALASSLRASE